MSMQRTPLRPNEIAPSPVRGDWPSEGSWRWACMITDVIRRGARETASVVNAATNPTVMGIGVELREITSGPMRDATGRILDAGIINIIAPNQANLALPVGRVFQDANYNVHFTGGYVAAIPTPALIPLGILAVDVEVDVHIQVQLVGGFNANVTWTALDSAAACDQPMHLAAPPQATMWHDYAAMAAAYGFLAPYNALATAVGLNSIQYTVVDR